MEPSEREIMESHRRLIEIRFGGGSAIGISGENSTPAYCADFDVEAVRLATLKKRYQTLEETLEGIRGGQTC